MILKSNKILIGVIIVLIGLLSIQRNFLAFDFGALTMTVIGLAFLLLYRQKKAVWSLFVGGYLSWMGLSKLLAWVGPVLSGPQMFAGMFFIVPGAIFMLLYFDKNKHGLLVPGCMLLWIGAGFVAAGLLKLDTRAAFGLVVMCAGFSFCTVYLIGRSYLSRGLMYLGIILAIAGALFSGGFVSLDGGKLSSYALIVIGVMVIIKSIAYKPRP